MNEAEKEEPIEKELEVKQKQNSVNLNKYL